MFVYFFKVDISSGDIKIKIAVWFILACGYVYIYKITIVIFLTSKNFWHRNWTFPRKVRELRDLCCIVWFYLSTASFVHLDSNSVVDPTSNGRWIFLTGQVCLDHLHHRVYRLNFVLFFIIGFIVNFLSY